MANQSHYRHRDFYQLFLKAGYGVVMLCFCGFIREEDRQWPFYSLELLTGKAKELPWGFF
jgi:hypothetical protein